MSKPVKAMRSHAALLRLMAGDGLKARAPERMALAFLLESQVRIEATVTLYLERADIAIQQNYARRVPFPETEHSK